MLSFNEEQIRNTDIYRNSILEGYKIFATFYGEYMTFRVRKGKSETAESGRIETYPQFNEQMVLFLQELNQ